MFEGLAFGLCKSRYFSARKMHLRGQVAAVSVTAPLCKPRSFMRFRGSGSKIGSRRRGHDGILARFLERGWEISNSRETIVTT